MFACRRSGCSPRSGCRKRPRERLRRGAEAQSHLPNACVRPPGREIRTRCRQFVDDADEGRLGSGNALVEVELVDLIVSGLTRCEGERVVRSAAHDATRPEPRVQRVPGHADSLGDDHDGDTRREVALDPVAELVGQERGSSYDVQSTFLGFWARQRGRLFLPASDPAGSQRRRRRGPPPIPTNRPRDPA